MQRSVSKSQPWTVKEIDQAVREDGTGTDYIKVPRFQRTLVWDEGQRRKLIDSLYRGYPIGAVLGYQTQEKKGTRNVVQIVDGLQRITAIHEYSKRPLFYAPVDILFDENFVNEILTIASRCGTYLEPDAVKSRLSEWLIKTGNTQMSEGFNSSDLIQILADSQKTFSDELKSEGKLINSKLDWIRDVVKDVESIQIPIVLYSGNIGNIPEIFERINSQGTSLTKYEILASSWATTQVHVANPEIREAVVEKYNVLKEKGYEIDGLPDSGTIGIDEHNLYEYLFGLGKVLTDKYPILFGESGNPDDVEPTGFVLVTTALGLRLSNMGELQKSWAARWGQGIIYPEFLEKAIFESCDEISKALRPFLSVKLNRKSAVNGVLHSQNQICSLISAYLAKRYDKITWADNGAASALDLRNNTPAHYLMDILGKRWRGSGDSRLFEVTWDSSGDLPANYYDKPISKKTLIQTVKIWHAEELTNQQKKRAPVTADTKAMLYFVYSGLVSVLLDQYQEYEIEHLYPVSTLASHILKKKEEGWPISALGNLSLLPKDINRIKQKNMLGDYLPVLEKNSEITKQEIASIQKYLITPNYESITTKSLKSKKEYLAFCESRLEGFIEQLIINLEVANSLSNH